MVPFENSNSVFFASSILKYIVVSAFSSPARFPVKLICCISFGSTSVACYLHKSIAITS